MMLVPFAATFAATRMTTSCCCRSMKSCPLKAKQCKSNCSMERHETAAFPLAASFPALESVRFTIEIVCECFDEDIAAIPDLVGRSRDPRPPRALV